MRKQGIMVMMAIFLCSAFILSFVLVQEAGAVPNFARKYRTSCQTCHTAFPRLNSFGEAFRQNGYTIPENDEAFVREEPVALGAAAYKRVWPEAVWPGEIPSSIPVSFRIESQFNYSPEGASKGNFEFPHEVEWLAAGTFGPYLSWGAFYALQDENEKAIFERIWLQFDDVFSWWGLPEDALNLKFGYFDIGAMPFTDNQRLTIERPLTNDFRQNSSQPRLRDSQSGIEAHGVLKDRFRYFAGVVHGDPDTPGDAQVSDENTEKDVYYRVEYKFGGLPLSGRGGAGGLGDTGYWDVSTSLLLGTFGYYGVDLVSTDVDSEWTRFGGHARLNWEKLNLDAVYLWGWDDASTTLAGASGAVNTHVYYVEANYLCYPWLITSLRWNDLNRDTGTIGSSGDIRELIPNVTALVRANFKVVAEARLHPDGEKDGGETDQYVIRFDYVF